MNSGNFILKLCNNFYYLTTFAKQKPVYMYHGTGLKNLQSILSQGLVINPKEKVWGEDPYSSFNFPSRVSVGGTYFTKNLMTAISSSRNANKDKKNDIIVIMAQLMPGSLLADEDSLPSAISQIRMPDAAPHESISCYLWADLHLDPNNADLLSAKKLYVNNCLDRIDQELEHNRAKKMHPSLKERMSEIFTDGFSIALQRQVSHIDDYHYKRCIETALGRDQFINQPSKSESEQKYSEYLDKITRALRILALSEISAPYGIKPARIEHDIGYSGKNKIIAIFRISAAMGNKEYEIIYQDPEGIPPEAMEDFISQYNS